MRTSNLLTDEPAIRERQTVRADAPAPAGRVTLNLNQNWLFRREDAPATSAPAPLSPPALTPAETLRWESVHLPHSARLEPLNASGGKNFQGICWYRRSLEVLPEWLGRRKLFLHFEGAMQVADVWLNGTHLLTHFGGYTPFTIDLTEAARPGDNDLVVRLDNNDDPEVPPGKPQSELDFVYFGGLYRNVRLVVADRLHITDPVSAGKVAGGGVFVTYPAVARENATVRVQTHVLNEDARPRPFTLVQELIDAEGNVVASCPKQQLLPPGRDATVEQLLHVRNPLLWHPPHPHLYTLRTALLDGQDVIDEQSHRIGIRHVRFDKDDGLFINGTRFLSIGANRHQDHPYVGYALPDSAHRRDVIKLREAGFTSVRSHYPQAPAFMDACDELGMLAIVSNPGWQFIGNETFKRRAIDNARLMVRRDRNRPSVILWEPALNETDNKPIGQALQQAVHDEYPGDQCYTAGDHEPGFSHRGAPGWDVEFWHNDGSKPYWIREWGDRVDNWSDQQSRNRVARSWGEGPMLVQALSHLQQFDQILLGHHGTSSGPDARRLCGACLWAGIDSQRGYHHQPFFGGPLDAFRIPKFSYHFFRSQRPAGVILPDIDSGPMVFVANLASFLSPTAVTVFSNCEQVRLLYGGNEIATRAPDPGHRVPHPPFTFGVDRFGDERSTMYMTTTAGRDVVPLELKAEGLIGGRVVATHTVRPPGAPARLELEADLCNTPLLADGADWVRVHARVTDRLGTLCPFADDLVTFEVQGPGRVIGDGDDRLHANPARADAGIATALLQSAPQPGQITLQASACGLSTARITLTSQPPETLSHSKSKHFHLNRAET